MRKLVAVAALVASAGCREKTPEEKAAPPEAAGNRFIFANNNIKATTVTIRMDGVRVGGADAGTDAGR